MSALRVEDTDMSRSLQGFSGQRRTYILTILIETMRREGYEFQVSKTTGALQE